jgi:hypothetical protein
VEVGARGRADVRRGGAGASVARSAGAGGWSTRRAAEVIGPRAAVRCRKKWLYGSRGRNRGVRVVAAQVDSCWCAGDSRGGT